MKLPPKSILFYSTPSEQLNDLWATIRIQAICRVPNALGKGYFPLDKAFAEDSTRQSASGKKSIGKEFFAERLLSGLPSAISALGKEKSPSRHRFR